MLHSMPSKTANPQNVVVIGVGFVGVATALYLQQQGHKVTIVDPQPLAQGAYFGNACTIANYANIPVATPEIVKQIPHLLFSKTSPLSIKWQYLPRLMPWLYQFLLSSQTRRVDEISHHLGHLLAYTNEAFAPIFKLIDGESLLRRQGALYLYSNKNSLDATQQTVAWRRRSGIPVEVLYQDEVAQLEPNLKRVYYGGLFFNDAYHILNPLYLLTKMLGAVRQQGGKLHVGKALSIQRSDVQTLQVITDTGVVKASQIVVAAGAWSKPLAKTVGDKLPLDTEQGYHLMYPNAQTLLQRPVGWADVGFYMTPMDNALRAAGTVEFGGVDNPANLKRIALMAQTVKRLLPEIQDYRSHWTGYRPSMPDSMPVIGPSKKDKAVYYAFGHGHLGVTLSAITGHIIANLISNEAPPVDIYPFRMDRF